VLNVTENNTFWHLIRCAVKNRHSATSELCFKYLQQVEKSVKNIISEKTHSLYIFLMLFTARMLLSLIYNYSGCTLKKGDKTFVLF